jgi:hypothetical protein
MVSVEGKRESEMANMRVGMKKGMRGWCEVAER